MAEEDNYYYKVMSYRLKNMRATNVSWQGLQRPHEKHHLGLHWWHVD